MKNRNILLFVLGSAILLAGQFWLTSRYAKPLPPSAVPTAESKAPAAAPIQPVAPAVAQASGAAPVVDPTLTHTLTTADLRLTWQVATGALKQAMWVEDGTPFFPETFGGLGAFQGESFRTVREEKSAEGTTVVFENGAGDRLAYAVPAKGLVIRVEGASSRNASLLLVASPATDVPVQHLGRVFTVKEKGVDAVTWADMLHDPFFSFVGAKRKVLPPTSDRLGLDAGLEKDSKHQRNHYFAALWKLPRLAGRDAAGYELLPENGRLSASLYLGPKQAEPLAAFEKPFTQVIDYGFFGAVAHLLFWILQKVHALVGNWGWAIVLFTVIIRGATWHLNTKQTVSMLRMKDFEPHQKAIQAKYEKFGSDMTKKAEMQKELMELYKKNGHNPMGGCLPMLLQMPIFLALWSMLNAVFELRHAPFFGWIVDLSARDPYYIFPVLMGVSMFAQQYITPAVGDPAQRKMMLVLMPAMMTFFFAQSPAGLVIYYFVFNLIGLIQTWWIMRSYQPQPIKV
ncbi:YidC/Oxa1 family insertase periplasmic-domain containing protein [Geothrix sp. 21YS21S-4]|uniref:YidC/Oxa1 family insertase periplasmic-domain containing protein n=1 Tax=Geothrix sp. 21YS21S-4 TaxID=3068889 RepID=UPI0027B8D3C2|nr:YidC/Oxa1 family insertase periplasmic-domain containing protein [Geothrix sp. 21YS21S-4]